ncbi:hypothetical protein BJX61DRAFT_533182 [Aspergillus egyptiacus]|nr:hypothetical protein BJX61DRAFT_533182 [Aspergillus egyptiacus]
MVSTRHHPRDFPPPPTARATASPTPGDGNGPPINWVHTPTSAITLWLLFSVPLVLWDAGYVLARPHSMPGGKWHSIWSGYAWYGTVDYIYGWPAYNSRNGFTAAQTILNLVESAGYLYYLWVVYSHGTTAAGVGRGSHKSAFSWIFADSAVPGRAGATALLVAFGASVMTVSKTVLYWLQEYFSDYENIGHNRFWPLMAWIVMNGLWIVVPSYNIYVLGEEIVSSLVNAAPRQRGRPKLYISILIAKHMAPKEKKRVAIIGAGAAGMTCAATLANHPDRFAITLIESTSQTGGQATSLDLDATKHGASWLNDGVQGGSSIFRHTFKFFRDYGYSPHAVKLQVSFGKGADSFFTNVFPSPLIERFAAEIKKLKRVLRWIKLGMPVLGLLPVKVILKIFRFTPEFGTKMLLPLLALFLGTGNQTANVSAALLERLFDDPHLGLWTYDAETLLANLPTMFTFPRLGEFYHVWAEDLRNNRGVRILLNTEISILERGRKGVILTLHTPEGIRTETFDELVLCTPADESLNLLGGHATWKERFVLGGVRFFDDVTITHTDEKYFNRVFETSAKPELCATPKTQLQLDKLSFATSSPSICQRDGWKGFQPMYYTHSYAGDEQDKIEMGFDCSNYQHQFRESVGVGNPPLPPERHVYQTIFLDMDRQDLWTWDGIDPDKVLGKKWWHQFGHRWQHYLRVVPGMMFINGKNRTLFAGAWTLVNMHEIACISGIAAAYRLGASYETFDDFAQRLLSKYLLICHGVRFKGGGKKDV